MRNSYYLLALGVSAALGACGETTEETPPPVVTGDYDLKADITQDTTLEAGKTYTLKKHVFVLSGTLTILEGTTILGEPGTSLVITQNAKINAVGTVQKPIIFTSAQPEVSRDAGDWGGVVMLGKAPINVMGGSEKIEGFPDTAENTRYGGSDASHDCGKIKYVRIEYAGFELAPDNELNGLTLGGCGRSTEVNHIRVHKGADDGVEVFGGTVNLRHIVITQPDDDGLDWDFGWIGTGQFIIVQQNALVGNMGIEADSNKSDNDAMPRSAPDLWNLTLIGSGAAPGAAGKTQLAMHLRRGTGVRIHNSIIAHFADGAIDVDGAASVAQANSGGLTIENSIFFQNGPYPTELADKDNDGGFIEETFFADPTRNNVSTDPQLSAALNLQAPSFRPGAGSPALSGGATPPSGMETSATFIGAIGGDDWTAGWSGMQ